MCRHLVGPLIAALRPVAVACAIALTLCIAQRPATAQQPSWLSSATIYCVDPEIFSTDGLPGVTAELGRLHTLGVNVIWLMPIFPRGQATTVDGISHPSYDSPYCINNMEAIDPSMGTSADLTNLVATAHGYGMKVILDLALNATSWDNPLVTNDPQYYLHSDGNPDNVASIEDAWGDEDIAAFNLSTNEYGAQTYVAGVCRYWLQTYDLDGFRFDSADDPSGPSRTLPQSLMQTIQTQLQAIDPNVLMLGEEYNQQLALAPYGLDYDWTLQPAIVQATASGNSAAGLQSAWQNQIAGWPSGMLHMSITQDWDTNEDLSMYGGVAQTLDAAVFNFTISGVPEIFNGEEVANDTSGDNTHNQIDWTDSNSSEFQTFYTQLINLRDANPALQQGSTTWETNSASSQVSSYDRLSGSNEFFVEINFSGSSVSGTVAAPSGGAWTDVSPSASPGGTAHELPSTGNFSLRPYDFAIFQRGGTPTAATPTFSPAAGSYNGAQSVAISDATSGAKIYYTTDGAAPTTSSALYAGAIAVSATETIEAIAAASGYNNSAIGSAAYTIYSGAPGSLTGSVTTVGSAQAFNLTTLGPTDWAAWGYSGYDHDSSGGGQIANAAAYGGGSLNSFTSSFLGFTWTNGTPDTSATNETNGYYNAGGVGDGFSFTAPASTTAQTLTVFVGGWTTGGTLTATLSDGSAAPYTDSSLSNSGNSYYGYYTLTYKSGNPNQTLNVVWKQASGSGNVTLYAAALSSSGTPTAATPAFSPAAGSYDGAQSVAISDTTAGAKIYYTVDGTTPTTSSALYGSAISVAASETVKAIAAASGYNNSAVASAAYTITNPPPAPTGLTATGGNAVVALTWNASSGAASYDIYRGAGSGGEGSSPIATGVTTTGYSDSAVANGSTCFYKVAGVDTAGAGALSNEASATPTAPAEGPYGGTPWAIPGTVQAENYDTGGQGVGYSVGSVNGTANSYRSDGVDIEACSDTGGGYDIGWSASGQWFRYTVDVASAGTYTVSFRVASGASSGGPYEFHLQNASGVNLSGEVVVPDTGGWETWTTVTATVSLPAGTQVLTLYQDSANFNVNYMTFAAAVSGSLTGAPTSIESAQAFNLTSLGTTDWAAWGYDGYDHDSTGGGEVANVSVYGAGGLNTFTSSFLGMTWTNGTPDGSVTDETDGYYNNAGTGDGFAFSVPAGTTSHTLTVFVGGWASGGTLSASLSDGSVPAYTDSSLSNSGNSYYGYYTLTFRSGSPNQTLAVKWTQAFGSGNVTIYAAALH